MVLKLKAGNGGRELNRPQLKKTHANRRKHMQIKETASSVSLHTCSKYSQFWAHFCFWLCCEYLEYFGVLWNWWRCFLNLGMFFFCMYFFLFACIIFSCGTLISLSLGSLRLSPPWQDNRDSRIKIFMILKLKTELL